MKKIFFAFLIMLFVSNIAMAGESQNVWGHAWSDNIGWTSFNCDNVRNGANDCSGSDYGVNIKAGGCFEGYAWSDNLGWISFNQNETGDPPGFPTIDETKGDCLAEAYEDTGATKIRGWARVLSGKDSDTDGFDGWIKFNGTNINTGIDNSNPRKFTGYAWGDVVNGWIQLSDNTKNFAVYTNYTSALRPEPPTNLNANLGDSCQYNITFSWDYNPPLNTNATDNPQYCAQIEVNGYTFKMSGTAESITRSMLNVDEMNLAYNTEYSYKVRTNTDKDNGCDLDDASDKWSSWSQGTFTSHPEYPDPKFSISPLEHRTDELVQLNNETPTDYTWQWIFEKSETDQNNYGEAGNGTDFGCEQFVDGEKTTVACNLSSKNLEFKFLNLYDYKITLQATNSSLPAGRQTCEITIEDRPAYEEIKDIGPDDLDDFINALSGSMAGFGSKILKVLSKPWMGLDFWR